MEAGGEAATGAILSPRQGASCRGGWDCERYWRASCRGGWQGIVPVFDASAWEEMKVLFVL